jgi:hypothetical protein
MIEDLKFNLFLGMTLIQTSVPDSYMNGLLAPEE